MKPHVIFIFALCTLCAVPLARAEADALRVRIPDPASVEGATELERGAPRADPTTRVYDSSGVEKAKGERFTFTHPVAWEVYAVDDAETLREFHANEGDKVCIVDIRIRRNVEPGRITTPAQKKALMSEATLKKSNPPGADFLNYKSIVVDSVECGILATHLAPKASRDSGEPHDPYVIKAIIPHDRYTIVVSALITGPGAPGSARAFFEKMQPQVVAFVQTFKYLGEKSSAPGAKAK